ncbi:2-octaprenyl-6-methoxyphenyl hydroxylase [Pandoraea terrae]|uniref:2-octaprenyl-6-methoxyphenyl hydroxylase n=1 Tax=Pandoraea terrae TaxID=1537710 RepID=A0A5E4Z3P3_9BURK|nr:UbiH/UbiF/VisC/COQ6 family ubiquinone biosynthesis hydroxylase [Pandoraea terrae]VVE55871.1 2-octaprenyl-6-methoxyphenyl hydroxylase [Pandoraea terrae]
MTSQAFPPPAEETRSSAVPGASIGEHPAPHYDVAIVGAGPVGTALALLLAQRSPHLRVALIDARGPQGGYDDPRALALSHGSRQILARAGAWPDADAHGAPHRLAATPIRHIHVSQAHHFGSTEIDCADHDVPALGYVVRYGALMRTLDGALDRLPMPATASAAVVPSEAAPGLTHLRPRRALALRQDASHVTLTVGGHDDHAGTLHATLAINAEGGLFEGQTARPLTRDYRQTALVAFVTCARPRAGWAWERFTSEGPLALLPLEHGYSLVWCCAPDDAERRLHADDRAFLDELHTAFGDRMGEFTAVASRARFPLGLNALGHVVDGRVAAIGNAAQTLHPVAGQGLNLGLRDAFDLTEALALARGAPGVEALRTFARRRRVDRGMTIRITDWLPRLFGVDAAPVATLRGLALLGLELAPPLKAAFARQMMFGQRG